MSWETQYKIPQIISHEILSDIISAINTASIQFGSIVHGNQDVKGKEQESISVRYVTDDFGIEEVCMGLYDAPFTTGHSLGMMIQDALIRLSLPIKEPRHTRRLDFV